jgi:hypothetical protein
MKNLTIKNIRWKLKVMWALHLLTVDKLMKYKRHRIIKDL